MELYGTDWIAVGLGIMLMMDKLLYLVQQIGSYPVLPRPYQIHEVSVGASTLVIYFKPVSL